MIGLLDIPLFLLHHSLFLVKNIAIETLIIWQKSVLLFSLYIYYEKSVICQLLDILGLHWWLNERSVVECFIYNEVRETFDNIKREI